MKAITTIIKYIIVFILAVSITMLTVVNIFSSTILKKEYVLSKLEETGYYEEIYNYAKSNFENYIGQSGLDEEILENIITKEMIKNDTITIIENIYDGKDKKIETDDIKQKLEENINKQIDSQNNLNSVQRQSRETQKKAVEQFVKHICDEYTTSLLHTSYENKINNYYKMIIKYKEIAEKALIITAGVCTILLLLLNIKSICSFFVQIGVSTLTPAILLLATEIFVHANIKIQNIVLINDAFAKIVKTIILDVLNSMTRCGSILLICSIIIIIVFNLIKARKYKIEKNI